MGSTVADQQRHVHINNNNDEVVSCVICAENLNKTTRKPVLCSYCNETVCLDCSKRFLMMKDDPVCMMCQHPWSREFVDSVFPKMFRESQYKNKREDVLFEREMSILPATQPLARAELLRRKIVSQCEKLREERKALMEKLAQLNSDISTAEECQWRLRNAVSGMHPVSLQAMDEFEQNTTSSTRGRYYALLYNISANTDTTSSGGSSSSERRQFIKKCPVGDCNGYLSTQYKCGMCGIKVCPDCLEIKEDTGLEAHVCNPDNIASAKLIASECKVCPNSKCAALVFKIDGCDQMWCTQCQTTFSWRTGKVETGRIHNPHYYEWQRRMNNGFVPREPGDGPCIDHNELNVPSLFTINANIRVLPWVGQVHRLLQHMLIHTLPRFQGQYDQANNLDLRIAYLLTEMDSSKMKKLLQQREKRRVKEASIRQVLEFFIASGSDLLRSLAAKAREYQQQHNNNGGHTRAAAATSASGNIHNNNNNSLQAEVSETYKMFLELRSVTNKAFEDVTKRFSCKLYYIDATWKINDNAMA